MEDRDISSAMKWTDEMSVGVGTLDEDHKKLIGMVSELSAAIQAGKDNEIMGRLLDELVAYTKEHFKREEVLFKKTQYPETAEHKVQHEALTKKAQEIQKKFRDGGAAVALPAETLKFLSNWLIKHIQGADKKYAGYLNSNGIT